MRTLGFTTKQNIIISTSKRFISTTKVKTNYTQYEIIRNQNVKIIN